MGSTLCSIMNENLSFNLEKGITFIENECKQVYISYSELKQNALKTLGCLQNRGIKRGDELILQIKDNYDYINVFWACLFGGIIAVPVSVGNNDEHKGKLFKIWETLNNPFIISDEKTFLNLEEYSVKSDKKSIYEEINLGKITISDIKNYSESGIEEIPLEGDIAFIQFSSGSTGDPKGVVLTHANLVANTKAIIAGAEMEISDILLSWMPLTHDMGLIGVHLTGSVLNANQAIMATEKFVTSPNLWMDMVSKYKATMLYSPNFGYKHLLKFHSDERSFDWDLSSVKLIYNGAEPISYNLCNEFNAKLSRYGLGKNTIFTVYGLAEASVAVSFPKAGSEIVPVNVNRHSLNIGEKVVECETDNCDNLTFVELGKAINDCYLRISNGTETLDDGFVGHVHIKGKNVTSGYYNNKVATDKIIGEDGWLDTGDLGFIRNGNLVITGRAKDIIFVNGQNYYAHDIERILENIEELELGKTAAVGITNEATGTDDIVLFVLYKRKNELFLPLDEKIRELLNSQISLTVKEIVPVKRIPKTTSGKVQRFKLKEMYMNGEFNDTLDHLKEIKDKNWNTNEIRTEREEELYTIWSQILETEKFNKTSGFFEIGGNSISMMGIIAKIYEKYNIEIGVKEFMELNNIYETAKYIDLHAKEISGKKYNPVFSDITDLNKPFALTDVQNAYLTGREIEFELGGVATHFYSEYETTMDIERLNRALNKLIKKHEMLRTVFEDNKQVILKNVPKYTLLTEDISHLTEKDQKIRASEVRDFMENRVYNTESWPIFEFRALKLNENKKILFVGFDLLIADAASLQIIGQELIEYYNNEERAIDKIDFTFRDYILSLEEFKKGEDYAKSKKYWNDKVDSFPSSPELPLMQQLENIDLTLLKNRLFKREELIIDESQWKKIKSYAKKIGVTPSVIALTAYAEMLSFWSNQNHFAVNLTVFNRYPFHSDVNKIVGDFTSLLLIEIDFRDKADFIEKAKSVQENLMNSLEHRYYDGVEFIRDIARKKKTGIKAIMPIVFTSMLFENGTDILDGWNQLGEIKYSISQTPQVYLDNQISEYYGGIRITWDYRECVLDKQVVSQMMDTFKRVFEEISIENHNFKSSVSESDRAFIEEYNNSYKKFGKNTLHGLFTDSAAKNPDKIALEYENNTITYSELDKKSNQVANYLIEKGIRRNKLVVLMATREIDTIVNALGILKAGGAYVPVDPEYPQDRKEFIIENSGCEFVIDSNLYYKEHLSIVSTELQQTDNLADENSLAYIIYTSGSTGKPKGVVIKHGPAVNTILDVNEKFGVTSEDRFLWISSMCFDLSVYDIFGAFSKGATMVIIPTQKDIDNIARVLDEKKITLWNSVPAIMELVVEKITEEKRGVLNKIMLSGDWIPVKLPEKIWKHWQNANIYSLGGATEASIWSIYYPIEKVEKDWKSIPYGMPLANQSFYVLNSDLNETPVEVSGELYIGGVGLAECYHNDPEKTEKSFINHKRLGRIYKTGDHGVLHRAGYIEFQGRKDFQVKIKGYRIELGEIEAAILEYKGIKSAVVIDNKDTDNNKYLCAFVVADESITAADIRASISTRLADYMIPAQIMTVDYIPLTSNGKVDRKRLIELLEESLRSKNSPLKSESRFISDDTTEKEIYGIWKNIFRNENIALDDNFFELGGDSLMGQRMLSEINKRFDVRIPAIELFRRQSIKALAEFLKTDMLPEKQIIIPSVNSTQSDELFFWAPNSHWRVENNNLVINDTVYETDYLQLFPKLYFTAQTGLTRENLENVCKNSALVEKAFDELRNNKVLIDTLQTPSEVFSSQRRLYKNKFGEEIKYNSVEYSKFKQSTINRQNNHTELKKVDIFDNSKEMPLFITERKSHRRFNEDGIITFKEFSKMVNMFKIADKDNTEKRRYYASAGGLYSIDIYLYIKDGRVENLDGGLYYFNPIDNKLVMIEQSFEQDGDVHYFKNREIFNSSAFTMYFIYNAEANMPIYGTDGYLYACIDTGLMVGHLTSIAELTNIGLCSIGEINFEKIKHHFNLHKNQLLIHTVEGGLKMNEVNNQIENKFQLSGAQKGIYILSMFNKEDLRYNNPLILKIDGNLDTEKVKFCFGELIKRHELLRASVKMENLIPYNVINAKGTLNFEIKEIGNNTIESLYNQFVTPFNLESETLMRILVVKESEESFYIMVDIHHVIGDRASLGIMLYELERLYNGETLPELKVTYRDYIEKLNRDKKKESYQVQREYWKNMFKDEIPLLELPTDYSRNELNQDNPLATSGGNYKFELSKEVKDRLTHLARNYKTTLYNILLASYYVMLYKYTGQKDIVVGTPVSMRDDADFSDTIGMFINTVALRNKIVPETSFGDFLNNVKETIYGAFENKGFAFEELVSELGINREHGRNPIFDTMFVLQDKNIFTLNMKNISVSVDEFCSTNSKFELTLLAVENENGLTLNFEYMKGLYKEESIKRMAKHFTNIVTAVTDKPETKVKDIEILGDDEKGIILHQFNKPFFDFDEKEKIFNRFEKIVGLYPDNIAVVYEDKNMTYRELNEKANQFARSLIINGVKPNEIVGLMVDKSLELMISILGVLKAGAAYLPLDINYPESRLEYMAKDSGLKVLITERKYASKCNSNAKLIFIDEIELDSYDNENLDIDYSEAELAYVIYTSGTTGNPKGVMIKHSGIISMIIGLENILNIDERDKITQFANISFDASVFEMFITLLNGAALYVLNMNVIGNYTQIENYINDNGITLMVLPPTYANYLNPENIKGLRLLFTAGSESNFELIKKWTSSDKPVRYINGYGPTENTICATTWEALDNLNYNTVPIGKPLDNIKTYICDRDLNLLPVGIPGELCLGGKNVGLGYLNKRELTDEKFVSASFDNSKIYKTGDLARWLSDGNIEFLGRIDQQVKIRGYRIELEEIEKKILSFEGVIEVCVIAKDSKNGEKYLAGYYTSNKEIQAVDLKSYLEKYLPGFMIPSFLVRLDKMPLTANDKIDKKQLAKINDIPQTSSSGEFTKKNQEEYTIEKIWKEVLNIDTVGLYDNFFEIGGSSIDLISVNTKINKEFKTDISAVNMFRYPTINSLADYIKNNSTTIENRDKEVVTTGRNRLKQRISMIRGGTNE